MTLKEKQFLFGKLFPELFLYAVSIGLHPVLGYGYRDKETQKRLVESGASDTYNSNHLRCLAVDIELFDDQGKYITATEGHKVLGLFWENLHPLCRWGGRINDGNHYSIAHEGVI